MCYGKMCKINPVSTESLYSKGYNFYRLGQNIKALEIYDEALRINPTNQEGGITKGLYSPLCQKLMMH